MTLYLLRHGPTGVTGAPVGSTDVPLADAAHARWPQVRAALRTLGCARVVSSDLVRARAHAADLDLPHTIDARLREQHFGAWELQPWARVGADDPFWRDPVTALPPGGESFADVAARVALPDGPRPVLVLAHAGPLRVLLARALGRDLAWALRQPWDHFGLTRIDDGSLVFHNQSTG